MEIVLGLLIIGILLLILGFGIDIIIFGLLGLFLLAIAGSGLVLLYFAVRLLFSKKRTAVFTRIGRPENRRYDVPYYRTEEGELPNVFPAEVVMKNRIYDTSKELRLRIDAGKRFVYDRNARLTIMIGVPLCGLLSLLLGLGFAVMLGNYS